MFTNMNYSWGYYIHDYLNLNISNLAKNGRSTRSFINEGLWANLLANTDPGDFVVIEHGHNDDGDPLVSDRAVFAGISNYSQIVNTTTGATETVYTFGHYLRKMVADVRAKKAIPILSGMVNRNYWNATTLRSEWLFADYAAQIAAEKKVEYIDHTRYSVALFQSMGPTLAKTYYPNDNTHTNWAGADLNAQTFVQAVKYKCNGTSQLARFINKNGTAITNPGNLGC